MLTLNIGNCTELAQYQNLIMMIMAKTGDLRNSMRAGDQKHIYNEQWPYKGVKHCGTVSELVAVRKFNTVVQPLETKRKLLHK